MLIYLNLHDSESFERLATYWNYQLLCIYDINNTPDHHPILSFFRWEVPMGLGLECPPRYPEGPLA